MRYHVLATDYDGTLAHDGVVSEATLDALGRLKASGRRLVMVTGRELDDLVAVFPGIGVFDLVVAENGALLYDPDTKAVRPLAPPPDQRFVELLRERGVSPLSVGRTIVATWEPHEATVLDAIKTLGLELQVEFNKGSVMVLPAGITKATGLRAALEDLGCSPHNAVGVGDAENDHAFLEVCEAAVAVSNALPALQGRADLVTSGAHGEGVAELAEMLLEDDLRRLEPALGRHAIVLGRSDGAGGRHVAIQPFGHNCMIAGPSGSGKSSLVAAILERLDTAGYQFCLVDPEGDYRKLEGAVVLGDEERAPTAWEVFEIIGRPGQSVVVTLLGLPLEDRPGFAQSLLPRIAELRGATGRPHWLIVDEAHHLLPAAWQPAPQTLPQALESSLLVTVHPDRVAPVALAEVDTLVVVGEAPADTLRAFVERARPRDSLPLPQTPDSLAAGEALLWQPGGEATTFRVAPAARELGRHRRKYAAGELPPSRSFYFRGPEGRLNLQAQNLQLFVQLAKGVDDETWQYHLERGDYSRWMREMIQDDELAGAVAAVERGGGTPGETRDAIAGVVWERYTAAV